jgi:ribosomal-protein-alanine N-acetyltransferase
MTDHIGPNGRSTPIHAPPTLETARLVVRPFTLDDAPFVRDLVDEPSFRDSVGERGVHDEPSARRYLEQGPLASYARHGFGLCCIETTLGTPVGMCGLLRRDGLDAPDLGFAIHPDHRGHGYAREASRAVLSFALGDLGLPRIVAVTSLTNSASAQVLEACGMRFVDLIELPGHDEPQRLYERTG